MKRPHTIATVLLCVACGAGAPGATPTSTLLPRTSSTSSSTSVTNTIVTSTSSSTTVADSTSTAPVVASTAAADPKRFDRIIDEWTAGSSDVSVLVSRNGRVVHEWVRSRRGDLTTAARFRIASISKVVTAATVLRLVDAGSLDLDRPILENLSTATGWPLGDPRMAAITTRHLLSHLSGFASNPDLYFASPTAGPDDVVRTILGGVLESDPGSTFEYSNANFVLLGRVVEMITARSYVEVAQAEVLSPLGIGDAEIISTDSWSPGDARHYVRPGRNYMELLGPAGAWVMSAKSVAVVLAAADPDGSGSLLSRRLARMMVSPSSAGVEDGSWTYGLGIRIFPDGSWGHTGTIESVRAVALRLTDSTILVVLVNGDAPRVTDDFLSALLFANVLEQLP